MIRDLDKSTGLRIKEIRMRIGLNQTAFGALFGVTQEAVSAWEHGISPDSRSLLDIAKHGNTSVEWLLTGKEKRRARGSAVIKGMGVSDRLFQGRKYGVGPLLHDYVVSGPPKVIEEKDIAGYLLIPLILGRKNISLMHMLGDNMEPILRKDDIVAICEWPADIDALEGLMVAAWLPTDGLALRWLSSDRDHWILYPENRRYPPLFIEKKQGVRFFRVVWWWGIQK